MAAPQQLHARMLQEVEKGVALRHPSFAHDASAPAIDPGVSVTKLDRTPHLNAIHQGVPLKHVGNPCDRSSPQIEPGLTVQNSHRAELLEEVVVAAGHRAVVHELKDGAPHLRHVDGGQVHDASTPVIPPGVTVHEWDKQGFLREVARASPDKLKHTEIMHDASKPVIEPGLTIGPNHHKELMEEVHSPPKLRHVDASP